MTLMRAVGHRLSYDVSVSLAALFFELLFCVVQLFRHRSEAGGKGVQEQLQVPVGLARYLWLFISVNNTKTWSLLKTNKSQVFCQGCGISILAIVQNHREIRK
jgi:hypothetical protein